MNKQFFDIAFRFDDKAYTGWVHPSDQLNEDGNPRSYHVVVNDTAFGNLSFANCKWSVDEQRPTALVKLIGKLIEKHYQF
jgi:hypothetical protein